MFLGGFLIWNLDNVFCRHLVHARNRIQLPWAVVLEGHGWWHILTGLGKDLLPPSPAMMRGSTKLTLFHLCPGGTYPLRPKSCADSHAVTLPILPVWLTLCLQLSLPHDLVESLGQRLSRRQREGVYAGLDTAEERTAGRAETRQQNTQENTVRLLGLGNLASSVYV